MKCQKCQKNIPDDSTFCLYCGAAQAKCQNCHMPIPEDSVFCQYCGATQEKSSLSNEQSNEEPEFEKSLPSQDASKIIKSEKKQKKTKALKTRKPFNKLIIPIAVLAALVLGLGSVNIVQYMNSQENKAAVQDLEKTISSQENEINGYKKRIDEQREEINRNNFKLAELTTIEVAAIERIGYAAENFRTMTGIVHLYSGCEQSIGLVANWPSGGTVNYSIANPTVADIWFNEDNWNYSTTITIRGEEEGATYIDFTNNVNNDVLRIIVIVDVL